MTGLNKCRVDGKRKSATYHVTEGHDLEDGLTGELEAGVGEDAHHLLQNTQDVQRHCHI